jgi:hypothetical protein
MKKLKLDIEAIEVESFDTRAATRGKEAVMAKAITEPFCCDNSVGTGCTDDGCCGAETYGGACNTSGHCDDISACWGTRC